MSFHSFVLQVTPIVDETISQLTVTPSKSIIAGWHFYSAVAASEDGVPLLTSTFTAPDLKITVLLKKYSKTDPIHRLLIHIISCFLVCTQIIVGSEIQGPHIVHLHIFCSYPLSSNPRAVTQMKILYVGKLFGTTSMCWIKKHTKRLRRSSLLILCWFYCPPCPPPRVHPL